MPSGTRMSSKRTVLSNPSRNRFIRSLPRNPIRHRLQRATSLNRIDAPTSPLRDLDPTVAELQAFIVMLDELAATLKVRR